jgi:hypothetical protein
MFNSRLAVAKNPRLAQTYERHKPGFKCSLRMTLNRNMSAQNICMYICINIYKRFYRFRMNHALPVHNARTFLCYGIDRVKHIRSAPRQRRAIVKRPRGFGRHYCCSFLSTYIGGFERACTPGTTNEYEAIKTTRYWRAHRLPACVEVTGSAKTSNPLGTTTVRAMTPALRTKTS